MTKRQVVPTAEQRAYQKLHGCPYAILCIVDDPDALSSPLTSSAVANEEVVRTLSKAEFIKACRRIFRSYMPAIEKGMLREHHSNFILRNQNRSSKIRFELLKQLLRLDLTGLPGLQGQFNRERDPFTEAKLLEIEQQVVGISG